MTPPVLALLAALMWGATAKSLTAKAETPLQVVVTPTQRVMAVRELAFRVVLQNISDAPLLLIGGGVLGNGRHAWSAINCAVQGAEGRPVPLGLHWRIGGVSGRVYMLGVVLGPGDTHAIEVTPDDYWQATALPTGKATLQCRFIGRASNGTEWPATWVGVASSVPAAVELTDGRTQGQAG